MGSMKAIVALIILSSFSTFGQENCALKVDKESIQVYTCGAENSKYKIIKAKFDVAATREQFVAMLLDIDHLGDWQYSTASAQLLKKINDHEIIYHTEVNAPVIDNRDFVIHLLIDRSMDRKITVTATSLPNYIPTKDMVVRIPMSKAVWKITEMAKNKLSIEYVIEIDFGGVVPAWVVNSLAHKAPYETFKSMKEKIGRYKSAAY